LFFLKGVFILLNCNSKGSALVKQQINNISFIIIYNSM
jgi:hypothetical protein